MRKNNNHKLRRVRHKNTIRIKRVKLLLRRVKNNQWFNNNNNLYHHKVPHCNQITKKN